MSVKIALLGFGTVASGVPFLLKENHEKITQAAQDEIEIAKVLVRDDAEKEKLQAAGHDYNFVTNVDEIIEDKDIAIVVELMGRIEPAKTLSPVRWKQANMWFLLTKTFLPFMEASC